VRAKVTVAAVAGETFKPVEIPDALRRKMEASL
jgi:acyl-CoA thioesterase FadM